MLLKKTMGISACAVAALSLSTMPAFAGQHGNGGAHGPSTTKAPTQTAHGPSTTGHTTTPTGQGGSKTPHGPSTTTQGGSTHTTTTGEKTNGSHSATTKTATGKSPKTTSTASTTTTSSTSTSTTTTVNFASTPLGQKLSSNTALSSKLQTRLQTLGYHGTVSEAAYGFKNLGQFVAATNVSRNLGIPFEQLKAQMTGIRVAADGTVTKANLSPTGTVTFVDPALVTNPAPTKSLGQSIQTLKTGVDATAAAQTATTQANAEIR